MLAIGKLGNDTPDVPVAPTTPSAVFEITSPVLDTPFYMSINSAGVSTCTVAPSGSAVRRNAAKPNDPGNGNGAGQGGGTTTTTSGSTTTTTIPPPKSEAPACMASPYTPSQGDILAFLPTKDKGQPAIYTVTEVVAPPGYTPIAPVSGALCAGLDTGTPLLGTAICPGPIVGHSDYRYLTLLLPNDQATPGAMNITLKGNDTQLSSSGAIFTVTRLDPTPAVPPAGYATLPVAVTTSCTHPVCSTSSASVTGLLPGDYLVTETTPPTGYSDAFATAQVVEVTPGVTTPVVADFSNTAILGQVTIQDTGNDTPFLPTGWATVSISGGPPGGIQSAMPAFLTTAWDAGCNCATTTFTSLMPGTYTVMVDSPSPGYQNPTPITQSIVVVQAQTTTIGFSELYVAGSVNVALYGNQSQSDPPSGATISVTGPSYPGGTQFTASCSGPVAFATPCPLGSLANLEPGIYTVAETGAPSSNYSLWGDGTPGDPQQVVVEPLNVSYPNPVQFYNVTQ